MAYDSATNTVALIHRGAAPYAQGSGELWYNISRNAGVSWRRVGGLNSGAELLSRYPSCAIANPTSSSDTGVVYFVYAAPQLLAGGAAFGRAMWGVDYPIGGGAGAAWQSIDADPSFWSNIHVWGATGDDAINWVVYRRGTVTYNDLYRWRTLDFISFPGEVPPTWAATSFNAGAFGLDIGGHERNGIHYFGKWGQWTGDPNIVDNPGYSTSTDAGVTWSAWTRPQPDWRSIPGLGGYDFWTYGGAGAYSFDMVVDANNRVHFFGVTLDTLTTQRQIVEIFETGTGWSSKWITTDLKETANLTYPGATALNQMGNHLNASMNASGTVMTLAWLDGSNQDTALTDIWFAYRRISDPSWSTPVNLTETPGFAELLLHVAPTLKSNGSNNYTMFIGRSYESGVTTYPPVAENLTVFYAGTHSFTATPTGVSEEGTSPKSFALSQNYPNPFNPSTTIRYSVAQAGRVSLKVFNTLGQQVATLVDENVSPGEYKATFDASRISSGVYFYKMTAGSFTETKKLMLVK
jgi:hypothetical protein